MTRAVERAIFETGRKFFPGLVASGGEDYDEEGKL
jgi:hypothetical protein